MRLGVLQEADINIQGSGHVGEFHERVHAHVVQVALHAMALNSCSVLGNEICTDNDYPACVM